MTHIPLLIRMLFSTIIFSIGVYLVQQSHRLVIEADEPKLVIWGVYTLTRHPMYLGSMLLELGLVITTLSMLSLLVWGVIFIIYNQFAAYEENSLLEVLGEEYKEYENTVKRWGLF